MANFYVIQNDPIQYKEQILKFWEDYLPGTPPGRFEWMNQGNPAGPAIWFFAFDSKNNELAGVISIMPKEMFLNGKTIRSGILGDFMINKKYRVFGPSLLLLRTAQESLPNLGLKFIYTIPNLGSEGLIKRVGFNEIGALQHFVKPLEISHYLNRHMNSLIAYLISPFIKLGLKIISRETYTSAKGHFKEALRIDESFDLLWDKIELNQSNIIGVHSSVYLNWRYFQNPLYKFRVLTYKKDSKGDVLGFIVFTINQDKLYIYDIVALNKIYIHRLLKKIVGIGRNENCLSINIGVFNTNPNPMLRIIKSSGFLNAKENISLFSFGEQERSFEGCNFLYGDRNI